jgi:RHS repeat-associated protein
MNTYKPDIMDHHIHIHHKFIMPARVYNACLTIVRRSFQLRRFIPVVFNYLIKAGARFQTSAFHWPSATVKLASFYNACQSLLLPINYQQKMKPVLILAQLFVLLATPTLHAQNDIQVQDIVLGNAEVSAPGQVALEPGFQAKEGCNFRAYIGPNQATQSSTTITPPSSNATPAAGTTGQNYIKTVTYRQAETTVPTGSFMNNEAIQYFDGLGRPNQTIAVGASPNGDDLIQPILYDNFGREPIKTLPYTDSKSGEFRTGVDETTVNTYYGTSSSTPAGIISDSLAYTQIGYDNSPLNRVVSQTGPGSHWSSKPVQINYLANDVSKPGWSVDDAGTFTGSDYSENSLYVTETIDEQGNTSREYKDKQGQVVLKESWLNSAWLQTRYIYDDFGLLRCVVPPEASGPSDTELCYYYNYDDRNRMIQKKIPGGGTTTMVYDNRDRLRCIQNANQSGSGEWGFTKYDGLNRPVITGTVTYTGSNIKTDISSDPLNESRDNTNTNYGYTNNTFPSSGENVLTVTYYDDYDFIAISGLNISDSLRSVRYDAAPYNFAAKTVAAPKGRVTGTMVKVLSAPTDAAAVPKNTLYSAVYYDKFGNVLRTASDNHLKGKDVASNIYEDITFLVTQTKQEHFKGAEHIILEKTFEYDHTGRLLATREKVNSQPEITLNAMQYNEVGEMITKYLHSDKVSDSRSFVQKVDYTYNIRGWLSQINDPTLGSDNDLFGMTLFYEGTTGMGSLDPGAGLYNGNIVGMKWNIKNDKTRGYQFSYDGLNRLLQANYAEGASLNANAGSFNESISSYDKNGNIKGLQRNYNNTLVDNLTYTYLNNNKSDQLQKITDTGTPSSDVDDYPGTSQDYTYDANGNMTYDGAKNLNITYNNTLNLPHTVDFGSNNRIFYHYTATGAKLVKHNKPSGSTDSYTHYIGNIVYQGGKLSYIITGEGRLVPIGEGADRRFLYEYNLKDHLGNSRVTFMGTSLGGAIDVVQTTSYYPFGLVLNQYNGNTASGYQKNKYLYNGKELQDDKMTSEALNWFDYGARFYDPQIGRWTTVDPLCEVNRKWSPYNYCKNNPIMFVDPDGMIDVPYENSYSGEDFNDDAIRKLQNNKIATDFNDKNGKLVKHVDDGSNAVFQQAGEGTDLYYQFTGYNGNENEIHWTDLNKPQTGKDEVTKESMENAIQEQQNLNMVNPALTPIPGGSTFCNYGLRNIQRTVGSAYGLDITLDGKANIMANGLSNSLYYIPVNQTTAQSTADNGGLAIIALYNPGGIGHVVTYSVGENKSKGIVANI